MQYNISSIQLDISLPFSEPSQPFVFGLQLTIFLEYFRSSLFSSLHEPSQVKSRILALRHPAIYSKHLKKQKSYT